MNLKNINQLVRFYIVVLFGISISLGILHGMFYEIKTGGIYWFDLDKERNIATWFSGVLFFLMSLTAFTAFVFEKKFNTKELIFRSPFLWLLIGVSGLFMSLDEITILHENFLWVEIREISESLGKRWVYLTQWQLVFLPVILLIFFYFILFFSQRFIVCRKSAIAAFSGIACWFLALALEGTRGALKFMGMIPYQMGVLLEEELEMFGTIFIMAAIIIYTVDIATNYTEERLVQLRQNNRFFTSRTLKKLAFLFIAILFSGWFISKSAQRQLESEMPIPSLFSKAKMMKAAREEMSRVWFGDIEKAVSFTNEEKKDFALEIVDRVIHRKNQVNLSFQIKEENFPAIVFISVRDGITPARVVVGRGTGFQEAGVSALKQLYNILSSDFKPRWIKVDIVDKTEEFIINNYKLPPVFQAGLQGIAFQQSTGAAFLPGELLGHNLVDRQNNLNLGSITSLPKRRFEFYSEYIKTFRKNRTLKLYLFSTTSFFSDGENISPLYRGHGLFNELSREKLLTSAVSGGDYLLRSIDSEGKFNYSYDPGKDQNSENYNMLRHAGSLYSMMELYEITENRNLLEAVKRGITYLLASSRPGVFNKDNAISIVETEVVKLGGNALACIAISKYIEITNDLNWLPVLKKLGNGILNMQKDNGSFIHKVSYPDKKIFEFLSEYYPGEAILALARIYQIDTDDKWIDAAEKAAQYLINTRDGGVSSRHLIPDHWLLYALKDIYPYRRNNIYLDHSLKIAKAIVNKQNTNPSYPDWYGSYYTPPRSTPTATRSEGLCAAYNLLQKFRPSPENKKILESVAAGIRFQLQTQFLPESEMYIKNPEKARGGFHRSLTNYEIRIDYVQHNISSLLCLHQTL